MSIRDRVSIVMRDVDVGRAGGDARERADVDRAGSVARDEYGDGERDDEERGTMKKGDDEERDEGADSSSGTSAPAAGLQVPSGCGGRA